MGDFERDTAVRAMGDGLFSCDVAPDWWVVNGPNGGYLGAIVARALEAIAGRPGRPLRSVTFHYLRAPEAGPASIETSLEREGRSVSFARARLRQAERTCVTAMGVFVGDRGGLEVERAVAPDIPPPEALSPLADAPEAPPFARELHYRPALGAAPFSGADEALVGGWARFRDERPLDAAALVALCDSWVPAVFSMAEGPLAVPTLELTVHVRAATLPEPSGWTLGRFTTRVARGGVMEEDGKIFSSRGDLLAQSRQLALAG